MSILVLTHDLNAAIEWIKSQDEFNIFILDEREIAKQNPNKFQIGFENFNYTIAMVDTMRVMRRTYKSKRPLVIVMDMRHQTAVDNIDHNYSILYYDNSMKTRLAYHPIYKTTYTVSNFNDRLLQNLLQNSS